MTTHHDIAQRFALPMSSLPIPRPEEPMWAPSDMVQPHTIGSIGEYLRERSPTLAPHQNRNKRMLQSYGGEKDNMSVRTADALLISRMSNASGRVFVPLVLGYSYSTLIAILVRNCAYAHTDGGYELWLSDSHYSQTTSRHASLYRAAFTQQQIALHKRLNPQPAHSTQPTHPDPAPYEKVFYVDFLKDLSHSHRWGAVPEHMPIHRADPRRESLIRAQFAATSVLHGADLPRLHEHTRTLRIDSAAGCLDNAVNHLTQWIPSMQTNTHIHNATPIYQDLELKRQQLVAGLTSQLEFVRTLQALPIDEARVLIRAQRELDA